MPGPGLDLEQIGRVLKHARGARAAAASRDPSEHDLLPLLLSSLSELIEITERLLAQRTQMESRLHRTPFPPPADEMQSMSQHPDPR